MKSLVIYHRKRGSVHGCVVDSPAARKRLEAVLRCIENQDAHYVVCEIDGDWRDRGYEEIADACRCQCKSENEDQLDDKIYIVVPRGVTPVRIFGNGKEKKNNMRKFSNAMMLDGNLHEGDYVETTDGRVGYIKSICRCEKCRERGFYEPIVHFTDGEEDCITKYEAENPAGNWRYVPTAEETAGSAKSVFMCRSGTMCAARAVGSPCLGGARVPLRQAGTD